MIFGHVLQMESVLGFKLMSQVKMQNHHKYWVASTEISSLFPLSSVCVILNVFKFFLVSLAVMEILDQTHPKYS